jgi:hypothetical protein
MDILRRWGFSLLVVGLALLAAWVEMASTSAVTLPEVPPRKKTRNATSGPLESAIRDPFLTGSEWRSIVRERTERTRAGPSGRPEAAAADLVLLGTMLSGKVRYAVMSDGLFAEGARVGKFRIQSISLDRVVLSADGHTVVLRVQNPGGSTGPAPVEPPSRP